MSCVLGDTQGYPLLCVPDSLICSSTARHPFRPFVVGHTRAAQPIASGPPCFFASDLFRLGPSLLRTRVPKGSIATGELLLLLLDPFDPLFPIWVRRYYLCTYLVARVPLSCTPYDHPLSITHGRSTSICLIFEFVFRFISVRLTCRRIRNLLLLFLPVHKLDCFCWLWFFVLVQRATFLRIRRRSLIPPLAPIDPTVDSHLLPPRVCEVATHSTHVPRFASDSFSVLLAVFTTAYH